MNEDIGASPDGDRAAPASQPSPSVSGKAGIPSAGVIVHNVIDRRGDWIGPWEIEPEPVDISKLWAGDEGRTVIYRDFGRAEVGTLSNWNATTVFARFHKGDTAAGCDPRDLHFAIRDATSDFYHPPASAMSTGTAKTAQPVEGRSPASAVPQADAQPQPVDHP